MRYDVNEAIESARSIHDRRGTTSTSVSKRLSRNFVRALVLAVINELPSDMTLGDLVEELT